MFGIGSTELIVILIVALIVLGPKTLASLSKTLGKTVGEFRRVSNDFQRTLNAEAAQEEYEAAKQKREAEKKAAAEKAAKEAEEQKSQTAAAEKAPADAAPAASAPAEKAAAKAETPAETRA